MQNKKCVFDITGDSFIVEEDEVVGVDAEALFGAAFDDEPPILLWLFSVGDKIISVTKKNITFNHWRTKMYI